MTDQDKIEKAREACMPNEIWVMPHSIEKIAATVWFDKEGGKGGVKYVKAAPVSGGEEQAALDALERLRPQISLLPTSLQEKAIEDIDTIRKAIQSRPDVAEVTVEDLLEENNNYLPFEGYRGMYDDCKQNVRTALRWIAKKNPNGLRIVAEKSGSK